MDLLCFSFCFALVVKEASSKQTNSSLRVFVPACVHSFPCTACTIDVQFPECVLIDCCEDASHKIYFEIG